MPKTPANHQRPGKKHWPNSPSQTRKDPALWTLWSQDFWPPKPWDHKFLWSKPIWYISLVAQAVKRLPTMWETWVRSLGREDPLEKEMATHCSTLAWKIPWMEEPGRLRVRGVAKSRTQLSDFTLSPFVVFCYNNPGKWIQTLCSVIHELDKNVNCIWGIFKRRFFTIAISIAFFHFTSTRPQLNK